MIAIFIFDAIQMVLHIILYGTNKMAKVHSKTKVLFVTYFFHWYKGTFVIAEH